jgi:ADP-heptose:LPS heptosyltransferase
VNQENGNPRGPDKILHVSSPEVPARLNPDRLRWIDYWIGIPICLALTAWSRVAGLLFSSAGDAAARPQNVLFIELAEMGSTVLACPAVRRLQAAYPGCRVFFLVFKHIDESVRVLDLIPDEQVLTIDVSSARSLIRDTLRFMRAARRERIDTVVNLETFARFSAILSYVSGARTRVGFHPFTQRGLYIGDLFTHRVIYNPHIHTWQSMVALVQALEGSIDELPLGKFPAAPPEERIIPRIASDPSVRRRVQILLADASPALAGKRLIVVNPNASRLISIRKWPLEHYTRLVERLLQHPRNACVITGVASEREDAQFILDRVKSDRLVSLTGKTSLRELIELFTMADLLVTNDSGPAHFAALTDVHVVVFFGPETPELYRPLTNRCTVMHLHYACSPCVSAYNQRRSVCTNNRCLTSISVETAHAAIVEILDGAAGAAAASSAIRANERCAN